MKHRTEVHNETTISGDTRADWSEAFELVPSLQIAVCLARIEVHPRSPGWPPADRLSSFQKFPLCLFLQRHLPPRTSTALLSAMCLLKNRSI